MPEQAPWATGFQSVVTASAVSRTKDSSVDELVRELRDVIDGEVRFDEGSRALYAHDLSVYRQVPIGVVIPKS
ncbi:MAG TPA: hypothetical protein VFM42_05230, partial [Sphingomicrobium sp.]|nr:hypothetical protein [Sphingomicrobium sp.]